MGEKKNARDKGKSMGDIDCWDFEAAPSFKDRTERFKDKCKLTASVYNIIDSMDSGYIPQSDNKVLLEQMRNTVKMISGRLKDLRENMIKLNQGIEKFTQLGESENNNWRKTKYAPVISSMKVYKFICF